MSNKKIMKKTDYRKIFALSAIYLIMSLTFFTANALAAFTSSISGENLVNGWRKADDMTIFDVYADANVSLMKSDGTWEPLICNVDSSNLYHCEYFLEKTVVNDDVINLKLRHELPNPVTYDKTLKIDRLPPKIERLNITKDNGILTVDFSVKDYGYDGGTDCSGIDYISYVIGSESNQLIFNQTTCSYSETLVFNNSGTYQADFPISISVLDKLGASASNDTLITLDFQNPEIQDGLSIIRGGISQDTLSTNVDVIADVTVYISDINLDTSRITGDLSGLNPNPAINTLLKNKQAGCIVETEGFYKCTFAGIQIRPRNDTLSINVKAYDKDNNYAEKTVVKVLNILSDPGQPSYIGPLKSHCTADLAKCYTRSGPQSFILEINPGSNYSIPLSYGFNDQKGFAICSFEEAKWTCYAPHTVTESGQLKVYVAYPSADLYGNQLSSIERLITVDNTPPIITSNITPSFPNCAGSQDTLDLSFTVTESTSEELKTYVNTSGFTNSDMTNGTCEKTVNNDWLCTISITGFVSEYEKYDRSVIVEDLAGNIVSKTYTFEVCENDENAVPNIITKVEQENDISIDRRTASLIPVKTYVPLTITHNTGTIIGMTVDNCQADDENGVSVLDSGHYFIDNTLVLYIGYSGAILPKEEFDINCTMNAKIRVGNKLYLNPEKESFIINVEPYNNPIGTLDSSVEKKISDEKAALRDLDSEIKTRESINNIIGKICDIAQLVAKINGLLQTLKAAVYAVALIISWFSMPIANEIWRWTDTPLSFFDQNVAQYVWPTSIIGGTLYGQAIKYTCMLYTCQHYKVSGLYTFGEAGLALLKGNTQEALDKAEKSKDADPSKTGKTLDKGEISIDNLIKKIGKDNIVIDDDGNIIIDKNSLEKWKLDPNTGYYVKINEETSIDGTTTTTTETSATTSTTTDGTTTLKTNYIPSTEEVTIKEKQEIVISGINYDKYILSNGQTVVIDNANQLRFLEGKNGELDLYVPNENEIVKYEDAVDGYSSENLIKKIGIDNIVIDDGESRIMNMKTGEVWLQGENQKYFLREISYSLDELMNEIPDYEYVNGNTNEIKEADGTLWKLDKKDNRYYREKHLSDANILKDDYGHIILNEYGDDIAWYPGVGYGYNNLVLGISADTSNKMYLMFNSMDNPDMNKYNIDKYGDLYSYTSARDAFGPIDPLTIQKRPTSQQLTAFYNDYPDLANIILPVELKLNNNNLDALTRKNTEITHTPFTMHSVNVPTYDPLAYDSTDSSGGFDFSAANQQYLNRNLKFYSALENEDWIINPYRSTHWDSLCAPAVLYNLQKEKQIRCKYVSCLEAQTTSGMPSYVCDRDFGMESCLYLDSAQWHITGGDFFDNIGPGFLKSAFSFIIGMAPYAAYSLACTNYQVRFNAGTAAGASGAESANLVTGSGDVFCGIGGVALQFNEIKSLFTESYWDSFFSSDIPKDPSEIQDFCNGVDYSE